VLALGAHHGDGDLDVRVLHALFRAQAEVDLVGERDGERVLLECGAVLARVRFDGSELRPVPAGRGACELGRPERTVPGGLVVEPADPREAPGAVHEDADPDALALAVAQVV
jgi:hypothetical protein